MADCYFRGCTAAAKTVEHVPPKSFFPVNQRRNLLTVPSCVTHNNFKSQDDTYVLAHITMNASPRNGARDVFLKSVVPQLGSKPESLHAQLVTDFKRSPLGGVVYQVNHDRINEYFDALCFALYAKAHRSQLPTTYTLRHIYHDLIDCRVLSPYWLMKKLTLVMYKHVLKGAASKVQVKCDNPDIYQAHLFGLPGRPLTITHEFYRHFRVSSYLTPIEGANNSSKPTPLSGAA